jgi:hypothetical protein
VSSANAKVLQTLAFASSWQKDHFAPAIWKFLSAFALLPRMTALVACTLFSSARVAASFEGELEPDIDDTQGDLDGNHALPHGKDVRVIMLPGEFSRFVIPTKSAPCALDLVGRDCFTIAGSAYYDTQLRLAINDRLGCRDDPQWIIG